MLARNAVTASTSTCAELTSSGRSQPFHAATFGTTRIVPMPYPRTLAMALFFGLPAFTQAQPVNTDCANALGLCAGQAMAGNNADATTDPGPCPGTGHALWYTFRTNSVGGAGTVSIQDLDCPSIAGMDNELSVAVMAGDGSCDLPQFNLLACAQDSTAFTTALSGLLPDTTYWLLVSGVADDGALVQAQCGFSLAVSGPGIDVVNVDFDAGPDVIIPLGGNTQLHATGGTTYAWTPSSGLSGNTVPDPVARPIETTTYTVETTLDGCTFTDQVTVSVVRLVNPVNTFTPNGDGINDTWEIQGLQDHPQAEVSIYDRWGQRVYHSIGYKEPFNGAELPTATYYWYIQVNDPGGPSDPYTGHVTLVR
jgi:gliding motility-associated-like protein